MNDIVILDDYQDAATSLGPWERLGDVRIRNVTKFLATHSERVAALREANVIVAMRERTPFDRALLEALPQLELLVTTGKQNVAIDLAAAEAQGVTVCGTRGSGSPTAELTWGLIIATARHLVDEDSNTRRGAWQRSVGLQLDGATLSVIGLGRIGTQVARVGRAFGMHVLAWSHNLDPDHAVSVGAEPVDYETLIRRADVLTIHVQLSERTRHLIGSREFEMMKPTARLVNTSRAEIVDHDALCSALRGGVIAGAGIDVYPTEPIRPDDPILDAPNTVLTPHIGFVTDANYRTYFDDVVENIEAFRAGTPIRVIVN